jgi:hypothetical protein
LDAGGNRFIQACLRKSLKDKHGKVSPSDLDTLVMEFMKTEHPGEYENILTSNSESTIVEDTQKTLGVNYLRVCTDQGITDRKSIDNDAVFDEFVNVGFYRRTRLPKSECAKFAAAGFH